MIRTGWSVLLVFGVWVQTSWAALEFSPSFLGMYRKTMVIEKELLKYASRHGVNPHTARAVLLQESGGNDKLTSSAGARGYFQVMPGTFRLMRVRSNIEAGIKYLGQMQRRFGREDYAIAAYNAGPGRIGTKRPLPLETLQYVISVGYYKSILRFHESTIVQHASALQLRRVQKGDSWQSLSRRTGIPSPLLRLYNPFLSLRPLRVGSLIAYPESAPELLLESDGEFFYYTSRIGDSHLNLAFVFEIAPDTLRQDNDLWRLQRLEPGIQLRLSLPAASPFRSLATKTVPQPLPIQVAALSISQQTSVIEPPPVKKKPRVVKKSKSSKKKVKKSQRAKKRSRRVYNVRRGDTLGEIAQRYGTSVRAIMRANGLRSSRIRTGASLQIPRG